MKKTWEKPDCPICNTDNHLSPLWQDVTTWEYSGKFTVFECKKCGLAFQSPRAPFKHAISYYPSKGYWGRDVRRLKKTRGWKKERVNSYNFLYKGILKRKSAGAILDIGSGLGLFLSKFKELGWEVLGTDISKDVAKYSQKVFNVKVLTGDIVKLKLPTKHFDVITMNNVLEHIYTPRKTLQKIHKLLKNNGILVIAVPNLEGLGRCLFGRNWFQIQPGRHLYYFSPKTITRLLKETGFEVDEISHSYWVHNYYSLFQSIRYMLSPKFRKSPRGGLEKGRVDEAVKPSDFSLMMEMGKIATKSVAFTISIIELVIGRGEIMTVYAKKSKKNKN